MNNHINPASTVGLISYWRFNEGTGSSSVDLQSGNDVTLSGNNWDPSVPFNQVPPMPIITFNGNMLTASAASGQWFLDGVAILGATAMDHTPAMPGDYTFTTDPNINGCTNTSAIYTITSVGFQNLSESLNVIVYPNPMIDQAIFVVQSNESYSNVSLEISDIAGRVVYTENTVIKQGLNQININRNMLTSGMYFYHISNNNKSLNKGKLMVK
jgi:hypothetical protein